MQSRYEDVGAQAAIERWGAHGEAVALRVYTSRLIGQDPGLVLHGGGNTSVKGRRRTLLGDDVECLWVKGSGSSLDRVEPRDLPALDLAYLRRLRTLDQLSDEEMQNQLRTHLFDASSPNPSVEALLHAFLPQTFVDHSHADAICVLTNQEDGEAILRDAMGDGVLVLPFIMPGFPLAKAVADAFERAPTAHGIVLAKHGLFTFGDTARESYERHIELVDRAERFALSRAEGRVVSFSSLTPEESRERMGTVGPVLRGLLAERRVDADTKRVVLELDDSPATLGALGIEDAAALFSTGPLTPDHVIRTKAMPLFVHAPAWGDPSRLAEQLRAGVSAYRDAYDAYFARSCKARGVTRTKLDSGPRVVLLPGLGAIGVGATKKAARVASDITRHTLRGKVLAAEVGAYEALDELDLFDMEYWSLEQAKLGHATPRALDGQVALVTGGAGAIGAAILERCAASGAHVVAVDRDGDRARAAAEEIDARFGCGTALGVEADVTDEASMRRAFDETCVAFGGVDLVVANAGVALVAAIERVSAAELRRLSDVNYIGVALTIREATRVLRAQGTGGSIVVNASKNVFAPGKDFGAYSASKAAALQIAKVAAIELAPLGVRVNAINADAIFAHGEVTSGLWDEVGPERAKSRGMSTEELPAFYRDRNLLKTAVQAAHVGDAVVFFASGAVSTTGATLPVDGGVAEAFPR